MYSFIPKQKYIYIYYTKILIVPKNITTKLMNIYKKKNYNQI